MKSVLTIAVIIITIATLIACNQRNEVSQTKVFTSECVATVKWLSGDSTKCSTNGPNDMFFADASIGDSIVLIHAIDGSPVECGGIKLRFWSHKGEEPIIAKNDDVVINYGVIVAKSER